ncbi:hypothetical protein THAOC_06498, partial [Thalassiosira oceanica]
MGVKGEGRTAITQESARRSTLKAMRDAIIKEKQAGRDYMPVMGIDADVLIVQGTHSCRGADPKVISEFYAEPPVPVQSVAKSVLGKVKMLTKHRWRALLVFGGLNSPLKADEHALRTDGKRDEKLKKLAEAMKNPDDFTRDEVLKLRKGCIRVREDIIQLVKDTLMKESFKVIGSAFETDHQLKALMNQDCIDAVWSTDTKLKKRSPGKFIDQDSESESGIIRSAMRWR